ncbi:MAG: PilZ domain-containing protein [Deltaproteobacteria bacterium]|nr:PilZ domain-containing protein [Deltaproteobacteria bacterium]
MSINQRNEERHLLDRLIKVYDHSDEMIGFLRNISTQGALILSKENHMEQDDLKLTFKTGNLNLKINDIDLKVTCRWTKNLKEKDLIEAGLRITVMNEKSKMGLSQLINQTSINAYL